MEVRSGKPKKKNLRCPKALGKKEAPDEFGRLLPKPAPTQGFKRNREAEKTGEKEKKKRSRRLRRHRVPHGLLRGGRGAGALAKPRFPAGPERGFGNQGEPLGNAKRDRLRKSPKSFFVVSSLFPPQQQGSRQSRQGRFFFPPPLPQQLKASGSQPRKKSPTSFLFFPPFFLPPPNSCRLWGLSPDRLRGGPGQP